MQLLARGGVVPTVDTRVQHPYICRQYRCSNTWCPTTAILLPLTVKYHISSVIKTNDDIRYCIYEQKSYTCTKVALDTEVHMDGNSHEQ